MGKEQKTRAPACTGLSGSEFTLSKSNMRRSCGSKHESVTFQMEMNDDAAEKTNTCRPTSLQAHTHKVDATTANEMKLMMSAICRRLWQMK